MRKHVLFLSMAALTLLAASTVFAVVWAFKTQEAGMDSMMRSYIMDLSESLSGTTAPDMGNMGNMGGMEHAYMMRFRMLTSSPVLQGDAGGVLILTAGGQILAASPGAEKLLPLRSGLVPDEPKELRIADGRAFYAVMRRMGDDLFVLVAISHAYLMGPMRDAWKARTALAVANSTAVLIGMLGLWLSLVVPLRRIVDGIRHMKWGRDRPRLPPHPVLFEVAALSGAIGELAEQALAREELRVRYVNDLVLIQEDVRKRLSRELHDGPLQSIVAAIKRIQLAEATPSPENLSAAEEIARHAAGEIRDCCDELSPSWVRLGLSDAMTENADRLSRTFGVAVEVEGADRVGEPSEEQVLALVRILQEAVSNSVRHGGAKRVEATFRRENGALVFRIRDDGRGFAAPPPGGEDADYELLRTTGHRGLANIHERVRLMRGTMRLESGPGVLIEIRIGEGERKPAPDGPPAS